ncbi:MAG: hypothetical protein WAV90_19440 [Gordonia amarae]
MPTRFRPPTSLRRGLALFAVVLASSVGVLVGGSADAGAAPGYVAVEHSDLDTLPHKDFAHVVVEYDSRIGTLYIEIAHASSLPTPGTLYDLAGLRLHEEITLYGTRGRPDDANSITLVANPAPTGESYAQLVVHPPNPGSAAKRITVKGRHFGGTAVYVTRSPALRGLTPRYLRGIAYDYLTYAPQVRFPGDVWNEQWLRWA